MELVVLGGIIVFQQIVIIQLVNRVLKANRVEPVGPPPSQPAAPPLPPHNYNRRKIMSIPRIPGV